MTNIRTLRQKAELSQAELAKKLGVTQGTVSQWESGQILPATAKLVKIAEALRCTVSDLFITERA